MICYGLPCFCVLFLVFCDLASLPGLILLTFRLTRSFPPAPPYLWMTRPASFVPRRKADDQFQGSRVRISASHIFPDPHSFLVQYLGFRDACFPLHPFLWVCADGSIPTCALFLQRFGLAFPSSAFSGHSLCAGRATSLAAAGVPPAQIQAISSVIVAAAASLYISVHCIS